MTNVENKSLQIYNLLFIKLVVLYCVFEKYDDCVYVLVFPSQVSRVLLVFMQACALSNVYSKMLFVFK